MPNSKHSRTRPEAQAISEWTPPRGTLGELVEAARERSRVLDNLSAGKTPVRSGADTLGAALRGDHVALIAEVKRSSPSKGVINNAIDAGSQASMYEAGGAAAVSILTEPTRFGGSDSDIDLARSRSALPVLKKDFHVTEAQIRQAAALDVAAALIIVRAISPSMLVTLSDLARDLALELLYEVRDERELERAVEVGARIIGVNNRNLETLEIDRSTVSRILPMIPPDCIAVAESGYATRADIVEASMAGADAVLVGSTLSSSTDPARAVRSLAGVNRLPRHPLQRPS
ncbi:MAG: indole-3-glycerol phosphate synthase TrpC [Gemmatimonadaceae bacterium]